MEDREIVALYLRRDEQAVRRTAEKFGSRLRALAYGIVQDRETAEECENDTYLEAWNSIPPHTPRDYLYAFLACITRRRALNCCRDRSRLKRRAFVCRLSEEMEQCIPHPDDLDCRLEDLALRDALNGFLRCLSAEKRRIFLRRYWYLDSIEEIARRFGLSQSKVKMTLHRCREQLRRHLEQEGYIL